MEVGSGRGWRWFPSGIEAFCEDWAAKRAWGKSPRDLRCAGGCCLPGIRAGRFWRVGFAQVRITLAVRRSGLPITHKYSLTAYSGCC